MAAAAAAASRNVPLLLAGSNSFNTCKSFLAAALTCTHVANLVIQWPDHHYPVWSHSQHMQSKNALSMTINPYRLKQAKVLSSDCLKLPALVAQVHATVAFSLWLPNQRAAPAARMLACWASSLASSAPYRPWSVSRSWLEWDRWPPESWSSLTAWPCDSTLSSCVPGQLPTTPHMLGTNQPCCLILFPEILSSLHTVKRRARSVAQNPYAWYKPAMFCDFVSLDAIRIDNVDVK